MNINEAKKILSNVSMANHVVSKELERLQNIERAYKTWQEKTNWIIEQKEWPFPITGKHRADIMKEMIEYYSAMLESEAQ
jgi:hypothetical protein